MKSATARHHFGPSLYRTPETAVLHQRAPYEMCYVLVVLPTPAFARLRPPYHLTTNVHRPTTPQTNTFPARGWRKKPAAEENAAAAFLKPRRETHGPQRPLLSSSQEVVITPPPALKKRRAAAVVTEVEETAAEMAMESEEGAQRRYLL